MPGCMITTVQSSASLLRTCCWQACWASHCSAGMIVRRSPLPLTAGVFLPAASGICSPSVPTWNCSLPGLPASSASSEYSSPAAPVRLPVPVVWVKPSRLEVTSPSG